MLHTYKDTKLHNPKLIDQAADCGYFWKISDRFHSTLTNMKQQASILKVATECNKEKGRKTVDKQSFVNYYFVSISNGKESKIIIMNKLTKYLSIPRSTTDAIFRRTRF